MRRPRVVVSTINRKAGVNLQNQLKDLLGKFIDFNLILYTKDNMQFIDCDIVLVPTQKMALNVARFLMPETQIIVIRRTLLKTQYEKIISIPFGSRVVVVNTHRGTTNQSISMMYELGASHLQFLPYYPGSDKQVFHNIDTIITPGEPQLVPNEDNSFIDIKETVVDISTIFDMLIKLNMLNNITKKILHSYVELIKPRSPGLISIIDSSFNNSEHLDLLLNIIDQGLIIYDKHNRINIINKNAEAIFKGFEQLYLGCDLSVFCSHEKLRDIHDKSIIENAIIKINTTHYLINKYPLYTKEIFIGGVISFKESEKIQNENKVIYRSTKNKGHVAKYFFEDILGNSPQIKELKNFAKKAAQTDDDILIEGESGTGKELLAQAIHNHSQRKSGPFVGFNCGALNSTLLESELFGYEKGAFTGANNNGKIGLFEMANGGTIFLDELGEISKEVQVKLLRVLQEREIIRVGGTDIIPINIRIIGATNKNLYTLVREKAFREDLFFRLNVINIRVPPLRERNGDILFFIKHYMKLNNTQRDIPKNLMDVFSSRDWKGNIRELMNCIQYMIHMSDGFELNGLPEYMKDEIYTDMKNTPLESNENMSEEMAILNYLKEAHEDNRKSSRKDISLILQKRGVNLSEYEVRNLLKKMETENLVKIVKGRGGTRITQSGLKFLCNHPK